MSALVQETNQEFRRSFEKHSDPYAVDRELTEGMTSKGCTLGSGPMPLYVKPYFIDGARMPEIRWTTEVLMRVMNKIVELYYRDSNSRGMFYLSPEETELADIQAGYHSRIQITRNDAFMTDDKLMYI